MLLFILISICILLAILYFLKIELLHVRKEILDGNSSKSLIFELYLLEEILEDINDT